MRIERHYTNEGVSPYDAIEFRTTTSEIRNPDGSIVFRLEDVQVPAAWSQVAADIIAQKYFRKAGVPARLKKDRRKYRAVLAVAVGGRQGRFGEPAERPAQRFGNRFAAGL